MNLLYYLALSALFSGDAEALSSPDFKARELAEARLTKYADLCQPLLARRHFKDAEGRRRAGRVIQSTLPRGYAHIAVLSRKPLLEWWGSDNTEAEGWVCIQTSRPSAKGHYVMAWARPSEEKTLLRWLACRYGERARTQHEWPGRGNWQSTNDGRAASKLLLEDLRKLGVPPPAVRLLAEWMLQREEALHRPGTSGGYPSYFIQ